MNDEIKWLEWANGEEWGKIQCPMFDDEYIMTYSAPEVPCYYTFTVPFVMNGDICYYRFDHDKGCWDESTLFCMGEYVEGIVVRFSED